MTSFEKKLNKRLFEAFDADEEGPRFSREGDAADYVWNVFEKGGRKKVLIPLPDPEVRRVEAVVFNSDTWDYDLIDNLEEYALDLHSQQQELEAKAQARQAPQVPPQE